MDLNPSNLNPELFSGDQSETTILEFSESTNVQPLESAKEVNLPVNMPFRRIYFYAEANLSDDLLDYMVASELVFLKGGAQIARGLSVVIGREDNPGTNVLSSQSRVSLCTGTGTPGANSIWVVFNNKFSAPSAYLNPCFLKMDADKLRLKINRVKCQGSGTVNKYRVFIAIVSSMNPWSG